MSTDSPTAPAPTTGSTTLDRMIADMQGRLAERGEIRIGSGVFDLGFLSGSLHTDFGPATQDKDVNQDYALAWWPRTSDTAGRVRFALAMADGVTSSFRAEWGAALACWVAVNTLAQENGTDDAPGVAERAFAAVARAIAGLAKEMALDPQSSCPAGQFISTWQYILRNGRLLETTLSLLWVEDDRLYLAMVGDGGAVWRHYGNGLSARPAKDSVMAQCDMDTNEVHALGPAGTNPEPLDCWREESLREGFLCALFSDGIGRSLGDTSLGILDDLDGFGGRTDQNVSHQYIARVLNDAPRRFDDNVTLAIVRGGDDNLGGRAG